KKAVEGEGEVRGAETERDRAAQEKTSVAQSELTGSLDIVTKPDGCAIWINGDLRPQLTPARIDKLPFGSELEVKLTKEGLEAYREKVTLSDAMPSKKIEAEMKGGSVTVVLKIDPPPTVWLDGRPRKGDRTKVDGISAGEEHKIVVSADGFAPRTYTILAQQGEVKTITDRLLREPSGGRGDTPDKPAAAPAKVRVGSKGGFCN